MSNTCQICCENFNKQKHTRVKCEFGDCGFEVCKECCRSYILANSSDAHCMNCKKIWSRGFLVRNLNRSFVLDEYSKHRKALLVQQEMAKMPETMPLAEREKECQKEEMVIKDLSKEIKILHDQINKLKDQQYRHQKNINKIRNNEPEKKKFIMPCPQSDCRGFLSTKYKCELCKIYACPTCLEVIGYTPDDEHTCNEDCVKNAEAIKKDTKPCPDCGVRIYKISGCDQMWCTQCKVAFSWKTGKIEKGTVHNPHWYEWQRNNNNGVVERNPNDAPGNCNNLISYGTLDRTICRKIRDLNKDLTTHILHCHRAVAHITHSCIPRIRTRINSVNNNELLRVDYLLGNTTADVLAKQVCSNDAKLQEYTQIIHVFEILTNVGVEMFYQLSRCEKVNKDFVCEVMNKLDEYNKLRVYCNEQLQEVSRTYNHQVVQFDDKWIEQREKFKLVKK